MDMQGRVDINKYIKAAKKVDNFITGSERMKSEYPVRKGLKELEIPEAVNDRQIVAMTIFKDRLIVATQRGVYEKVGDILCRIKFEDESPENPPLVAEGLTPWHGGAMIPVHPTDSVQIHFRNGNSVNYKFAKDLVWEHHGAGADIIAYKKINWE